MEMEIKEILKNSNKGNGNKQNKILVYFYKNVQFGLKKINKYFIFSCPICISSIYKYSLFRN
jgi:hypothetical protein